MRMGRKKLRTALDIHLKNMNDCIFQGVLAWASTQKNAEEER